MITIKRFEFNHFPVNTYVLHDETGEGVLIDCGCYFDNERQTLLDYLTQENIHLVRLLYTHLHFDHVMGNTWAMKQFELRPEAHRGDIEGLPSIAKQAEPFGLMMATDEEPPFITFDEGDVITFGTSRLEILHVPGHSPGSVCFVAEKFIIGGDVLFRESIGRTDLWGGSHQQLVEGIRTKLLPLAPNLVVYPGHGPATTIGFERDNNPFL